MSVNVKTVNVPTWVFVVVLWFTSDIHEHQSSSARLLTLCLSLLSLYLCPLQPLLSLLSVLLTDAI